MTPPYRLTPRAEQDVKAIGRYTLQQWGKAQRDTYLRALEHRFAWLAESPRRGRHRPDIQEGYYSYPQGAHVVFYLIRDGGIDILGILHQRRDVIRSFTV